MSTARPKARQDNRLKILRAARKHFAALGFEGASTRQIADDAGVAQSLLLYHFGSKDALWKAMMDDLFAWANLDVSVGPIRDDGLPLRDRLLAGLRGFTQITQQEPDLHRLMTLEGRTRSDRLVWLLETHVRPSYEAFTELLRQGQADGLVRPGDPVLIYYGMVSLIGSFYSFAPEISVMSGRPGKPDPAEVERLVTGWLFNSA